MILVQLHVSRRDMDQTKEIKVDVDGFSRFRKFFSLDVESRTWRVV